MTTERTRTETLTQDTIQEWHDQLSEDWGIFGLADSDRITTDQFRQLCQLGLAALASRQGAAPTPLSPWTRAQVEAVIGREENALAAWNKKVLDGKWSRDYIEMLMAYRDSLVPPTPETPGGQP